MPNFPASYFPDLRIEDQRAVEQWWAGLAIDEQTAAIRNWHPHIEVQFFQPQDGDDGEQLPVVIGGRFIPAEQSEMVSPEWSADYLEYLLINPELFPLEINQLGSYGAVVGCVAHPVARETLAAGCVPAAFSCPFDNGDCPMRRLLALKPNQSFQLLGPVRLVRNQAGSVPRMLMHNGAE